MNCPSVCVCVHPNLVLGISPILFEVELSHIWCVESPWGPGMSNTVFGSL